MSSSDAVIIEGLQLASLHESNLFLRCLWARLRSHFGKLGWQLMPRRDGATPTIVLGWISLDSTSTIEVSIRYVRAGVIHRIQFAPLSDLGAAFSGLDRGLRQCVAEALAQFRSHQTSMLSTQVATFPAKQIGYFKGERWFCRPLDTGHSEIAIQVHAFDEVDAQHGASAQLASLLDIIACMTNATFKPTGASGGASRSQSMEANRFCEDADWLEDLPYRDGRLCLTATHVAFCDKFVEGVVASESITRAASLFHTALKLYHRHEPDTYDVTNALFVSALEAITLPASDPSVCASCGLLTYRISQRVIDAAVRHLGPGVARFFKTITAGARNICTRAAFVTDTIYR